MSLYTANFELLLEILLTSSATHLLSYVDAITTFDVIDVVFVVKPSTSPLCKIVLKKSQFGYMGTYNNYGKNLE